MLVEAFWNMAESAAGKWATAFFPLHGGTIFLLIFTANMIKLLPGFESIGRIAESPHGEGYAPVEILPGFYSIDKGQPVHLEHAEVKRKRMPRKVNPARLARSYPSWRRLATDLTSPWLWQS